MTGIYVTSILTQVTDITLCLQTGSKGVSGVIFRHARKVNGDFYAQGNSEVVTKRLSLNVSRCKWPSSCLITIIVWR